MNDELCLLLVLFTGVLALLYTLRIDIYHIQTDILFLNNEIKVRKQAFGIEIYDLMAELEADQTLGVQEKEAKIRVAFDAARKDIAVIQAKKECKMEEMAVLEVESGEGMASPTAASMIPPSSGTIVTNMHPSELK
jgi:hypothetical protein